MTTTKASRIAIQKPSLPLGSRTVDHRVDVDGHEPAAGCAQQNAGGNGDTQHVGLLQVGLGQADHQQHAAEGQRRRHHQMAARLGIPRASRHRA